MDTTESRVDLLITIALSVAINMGCRVTNKIQHKLIRKAAHSAVSLPRFSSAFSYAVAVGSIIAVRDTGDDFVSVNIGMDIAKAWYKTLEC